MKWNSKKIISLLVVITLLLTSASAAFAGQSNPLYKEKILVTNNVESGKDTVTVSGLFNGDVVNVYTVATNGTAIGTKTASTTTSGAVVTATVSDLSLTSGSVYVSVTRNGETESKRVAQSIADETTSNIYITRYPLSSKDTVFVTVNNLAATTKVTVAKLKTATTYTTLKSGSVAKDSNTITLSMPYPTTDTVYVTVGTATAVKVDVPAAGTQPKTTSPTTSQVYVTNNYSEKGNVKDVVKVTGLSVGDIVNVYTASSGGTGTKATVAKNKAEVSISLKDQLAVGGETSGSIYVSVTVAGKTESERTAVAYADEANTTSVDADNVTLINETNAKAKDAVIVRGLQAGDIVAVYGTETLAKAAATKTEIVKGTVGTNQTYVVLTKADLFKDITKAYVTVTRKNMKVSLPTEVALD